MTGEKQAIYEKGYNDGRIKGYEEALKDAISWLRERPQKLNPNWVSAPFEVSYAFYGPIPGCFKVKGPPKRKPRRTTG